MSHHLTIHLAFRMQPKHRHDLEDALQDGLNKLFPGCQIDGGGTQLSKEGEPLSCDIELAVEGPPDKVLSAVIGYMNSCGAPRGSYAVLDEDEPVAFGVTDGIGLYLNGTDLPDEVYENSDPNELIARLNESLGDEGTYESYWQGPTETALYLYGPSGDRMRELIADVLATEAIAQRSRLVAIT